MGKKEIVPIGIPPKTPGIVIIIGDIPSDSPYLDAVREIIAETGGMAVLKDTSTTPVEKAEGLPITVENGTTGSSNN